MINSLKTLETQYALKNKSDYKKDEILKSLFLDFPKLERINFSKTSEYNDNDYSDYMRVVSVNNLSVYDQEYDTDDEKIEKTPKEKLFHSIELNHICHVVESLYDCYDTNAEGDHQTLLRKNYIEKKTPSKNKEEKAFDAYQDAIYNNEQIKDFSVFYNRPNWGLYYCMDMRTSFPEKDAEKILFSKENHYWVKYAYYYAENILKNRLPEKIEKKIKSVEKSIKLRSFEQENYYISDHEKEARYYCEKYNDFVKSLNISCNELCYTTYP